MTIGSAGQFAAAARGRILAGDAERALAGVSIDSRTIASGELFVAIVGQVHDGHDHVDQALARGAAAVAVSRADLAASLSARNVTVVLVDDTLRALQDAAAAVRDASDATVLAVTGSVGKSTTKELVRLLLAGDRPTHASPGNLNNHYGMPLALLAMPQGTRACVLELGVSYPGEMDRLLEVARPDWGLVTVIGTAHVGNYPSEDALADEKMKLPARSRGALLNADDAKQRARAAALRGEVRWFGEGAEAASGTRLVELRARGLAGSTLVVEHAGRRFELECPLAGRHAARNLLAAAAAAFAVGVEVETAQAQARLARPGKHRGEVLKVGGAVLVDDTYNASPAAMAAAIALLAETEARRRVLVAGDMRELGDATEPEHRRLGQLAASSGVDVLVGVGESARLAVEAARAAGLAETLALPDAEAAGAWLAGALKDGDAVLLKGSRAVGLDRAVERVAAGGAP